MGHGLAKVLYFAGEVRDFYEKKFLEQTKKKILA